jgi:hypothetical protein
LSSSPQAVGSLVIEEKVSSSGAGDVLLARQPGLGRRVLVKTLRRDALADAALVAHFRREARMAARVGHANVQQAFDLFAWQGDHYLVLEHVEGASLASWLERLGPPPREVALALLLELARGLEALHAAGVVHADLRAENARIGRWGEVKVGGLGWARTPAERDAPTPDVSTCTAPEVRGGSAPDTRSDVYALGCIGAGLAPVRGLGRAWRRARSADPARRPTAAVLRARIEHEVADPSPAAVRAQIAGWLVIRRGESEPAAAAPGASDGVSWFSRTARRAATAGAAVGLIAAALAGWERRDLLRPRMPESRPAPAAKALPPPPAETPLEPPSVDAGVPAALLEPAHLRFAVFPWGEIRIDGGDPILTPRAAPIDLPPGQHRIEIVHPTLGSELREITLAAGEHRTLRHVFDRTPVR